jgi:hypothetical protein
MRSKKIRARCSTANVGNLEALGSKFDSFNQRSAVKANGAMAKPKYDTPS